jgi:hypothetical protein
LIIVAFGAILFFIATELRAAEPILPLELFRNRNFTISSSVGLIVGISLFGSVTYLPIYLQVVKGETPTASQPPKAAFVTRLQPCRLPGRAARQLPDQSTTLWAESSSTSDPRLRGALPIGDIRPCTNSHCAQQQQ